VGLLQLLFESRPRFLGPGALATIADEDQPGVLTVTGLLPSVLEPSEGAAQEDGTSLQDEIVQDLCRRLRYLLTLKARPPFRLAGLEMVAHLTDVEHCLEHLILHRSTPTLLLLQQRLQAILQSIQASYQLLSEAATWLQQIAAILEPDAKPPRTGQQVQQDVFAFLQDIQQTHTPDPFLRKTLASMHKTTLRYAPGLFHCYDIPDLPRTNNDRESQFRDLYRRLLRTTGQKGLSRRILQREGAWELIPHPDSVPAILQAISHVAPPDFQLERSRLRLHRNRFKFHTRSPKRAQRQLLQLEQRWLASPPIPS
jgi:hypothetical protein